MNDGASAGGNTSSAAKPATVAETSSGKPGTMNDGASAAGNTSSAAKPAPAGKTEALSELRARLECKSSLPLVAEFLVNLRMFEEWRRTKRPSNISFSTISISNIATLSPFWPKQQLL